MFRYMFRWMSPKGEIAIDGGMKSQKCFSEDALQWTCSNVSSGFLFWCFSLSVDLLVNFGQNRMQKCNREF